MNYRITDEIKEQEEKEIFEGLLEYNLARLEDKNPKDLAIYLEDDFGKKFAGLIGDTHGNWLTIKFLWVTEAMRKQQIGSTLLQKAEKIAKERGCKFVFLDTFSFQSPKFYQKYGYKEVFTLEKYPVTGKRHYFTKNIGE